MLREREPVPHGVVRHVALSRVFAEAANQGRLDRGGFAAKPLQARLQPLARERAPSKREIRAVSTQALLPGVLEQQLVELRPVLDADLAHGRAFPVYSVARPGRGAHTAGVVSRGADRLGGVREASSHGDSVAFRGNDDGRPGRRSYTRCMAQAPALPRGFELPLEPRLPRIGSVDQVAVEERAASLAKRSIKHESKLFALDLAIRMIDLTTLEGADTPGKVAALSSKAMRPDPVDPTVPPVAAVCVYPNLVPVAKEKLGDSGIKVASVATGFPSGQFPTELKLSAVELGADEIDMVIDRGAFLSGRYAKVYDEIVRVKEAAGDVHVKVILETG